MKQQPQTSAARLTPAQATDLMDWVVAETRRALLKALTQKYARTKKPEDFPDLEKATLCGYCGFVQSFMDCLLRDTGCGSKVFFVQDLAPRSDYIHVALVAEIPTTEGVKKYLCDPTFKQFFRGEDTDPAPLLGNLADGEHMLGTLLKKGYLELTPAVAVNYLAAFSNGVPPLAAEKALEAFANPPANRLNRWVPRAELLSKGFLPAAPKP